MSQVLTNFVGDLIFYIFDMDNCAVNILSTFSENNPQGCVFTDDIGLAISILASTYRPHFKKKIPQIILSPSDVNEMIGDLLKEVRMLPGLYQFFIVSAFIAEVCIHCYRFNEFTTILYLWILLINLLEIKWIPTFGEVGGWRSVHKVAYAIVNGFMHFFAISSAKLRFPLLMKHFSETIAIEMNK